MRIVMKVANLSKVAETKEHFRAEVLSSYPCDDFLPEVICVPRPDLLASSPPAPVHCAYRLEDLRPDDPAFVAGEDNRALY